MALPNFIDVLKAPNFQELPDDQKVAKAQEYWNAYRRDNPTDTEYAQQQEQDAIKLLTTRSQVADAPVVEQRFMNAAIDASKVNLALREGLRSGKITPEQAQQIQAQENEKLTPIIEKSQRIKDFNTDVLTSLAEDARQGAYFTPEPLRQAAGLTDGTTTEARNQYESRRSIAANRYGLEESDIDDLVKHATNSQEEPVSRDAFGNIHIKDEVLFKGNDTVKSAINESNLPESVKKSQIEGLDEKLDNFRKSFIENVKTNYPELSRIYGIEKPEDFGKLQKVLNESVVSQLASGLGVGLLDTFNTLGKTGDKLPFGTSDPNEEALQKEFQDYQKARETINQLSFEFNKEKTNLFGANAASIGQGLVSVAESAALGALTRGFVPQISGSGKAVDALNKALKVAPTATIFGVRQGVDTYEQARERGMSESESAKLGLISGALETGLTLGFSSIGLGGAEDFGSAAVRETVKKSVRDSLLKFGKGVVGEELEENLINSLDSVLVQSKINPNMTVEDFKQSIWETTLATLLPSAVTSGIDSVSTFNQTTPQLEQRANEILASETNISPIEIEGGTDTQTSPQTLASERAGIEAQLETATGETREALQERLAEIDEEIVSQPQDVVTTPQPDVVEEVVTEPEPETVTEAQISPETVTEPTEIVTNEELPPEIVTEPTETVVNEEIVNEPQTTTPQEATPSSVEQPVEQLPDAPTQESVVTDANRGTEVQETQPVEIPQNATQEGIIQQDSQPRREEAEVRKEVAEAEEKANLTPSPDIPASDIQAPQLGLRKSLNTAIRRAFGVTDAKIKVEQSDKEAIFAAKAEIDKDPERGRKLVDSLAESGRPTTKTEAAILNHELVTRVNALEKAERAVQQAEDQGELQGALGRAEQLQADLSQVLNVILQQGSSAGLRLQAQKMILSRDYSPESLIRRAFAAKNKGADTRQDLTAQEITALKKEAENLKKRVDDLESALVDQEVAIRKEYESQAVERATKEVKAEKQKETQKAKKAKLDQEIAAAKQRFKQRQKDRFSGNNDRVYSAILPFEEADVVDAAIIATAYIRKGVISLQAFTAELVKEFGENARPYAQQIFDESKRVLNAAGLIKTPAQIIAENPEPNRQTAYNLMKAHLREGVKPSEVVDQVAKDLKLPREEASDLITGYNRQLNPTRSELLKQISDIRKAENLMRRISDLKNGVVRETRKRPQAEVSDEVKRLQEELKELLKASKVEVPRDPLQAAKTRLRTQIDAFEKAIADNQAIPKKERNQQTDAELEVLRKRRDQAKKDYDEAFPKLGPEYNAKIKRILELQKALDSNNPIAKKERTPKQKDEYDRQIEELTKLYKETFPELGPKLTAKQRQILDLQEAIANNRMLPAKQRNKRQETEDDRRLKELKKEYRKMFPGAPNPKTSPQDEIDKAVAALDKQIAREESDLQKDSTDFNWWSPEISARRQILDQKREARNELKWRENAEKSAREAIARAEEIIRTGKLPTPTTRKERTPTQNLQVLWDTRNQLQAVVSQMRRDGQAVSNLEKSIAELERRIREKDFSTKPRRQSNDPQVKALREAKKELQKTFNRLKNPPKSEEDRIVDAINKRTEKLREKIRKGDFSKEVRPDPLITKRIEKARFEYDKAKAEIDKGIAELALKNLTPTQKVFRALGATSSLLKMVKLAGDLGVLFRNVAAFTLNPLNWPKIPRMYINGIKAGLDFSGQQEYEIYRKYEESPIIKEFGGSKKIGLKLVNPLDEGGVAQDSGLDLNLIEEIAKRPFKTLGVGAVAKFTLALERTNRAWSNTARYESYAAWRGKAPMTLAQARGLAHAANIATGYGGFQKESVTGKDFERSVRFLNTWLTLSARWALSKVQIGTLVPVWGTPGFANKAKVLRDVYVGQVVGRVFIGGILKAAYLAYKGELPDDEEELKKELLTEFNPWDSGKSGKMDFEGTQLSFDGGNDAFISLMAKTLTRSEIKNGKWVDIKGADLGRKHLNYWLNRANPTIAAAVRSYITRENYDGKPLTWETAEGRNNLVDEWLEPIIVSDTKKIFEKHGAEGVALWLSMFHGANVRFEPEKKPKERKIKF